MDSNLWVRPLLGLDFEGLASILHDFFSENLWFFIHLVCLPHANGRVGREDSVRVSVGRAPDSVKITWQVKRMGHLIV